MPDEMKEYRKKATQQMRPYIPGESLIGVSVADGVTPEAGGMIAIAKHDARDAWYITPEFFSANYEAA